MTEDKMVGWHQQLNTHGFGWTLGVGDEQGGLECCSSWGREESDKTEQLSTKNIFLKLIIFWNEFVTFIIRKKKKSLQIAWES